MARGNAACSLVTAKEQPRLALSSIALIRPASSDGLIASVCGTGLGVKIAVAIRPTVGRHAAIALDRAIPLIAVGSGPVLIGRIAIGLRRLVPSAPRTGVIPVHLRGASVPLDVVCIPAGVVAVVVAAGTVAVCLS